MGVCVCVQFRDEVFWFPHNLDFRGRTYPCPPHFNHLGGYIEFVSIGVGIYICF